MKDNFRCFPFAETTEGKTLTVAARNDKEFEELARFYYSIPKLQRGNELIGFSASAKEDPADNYLHMYVFNN